MAGAGGDSGGATSGAIRAGRAFVELVLKDAALLRGLNRVKARFMELGRFMSKLGAVGALGGGLALKPVVDKFVEYDDAIRAVGARTEATAEQFGRLDAAARELGRSTSFSAVDVAKLMNVLGTRGFNPDQVIAMSKSVLDLARATGVEAPLAADILGAALKAFELDATDATGIADKFTVAANKSAVSMESLGETFQYVAPVAQKMGMTFDQALALAGALGNVGIAGSEAGTALRGIGVLIASGGADLQRIFGVSGKDAAGNVRPIIDVLNDIEKSMEGLGNADKIERLNEMFGLLRITSAAALGKASVSVRELEDAIANSGGTAAKTAALMDSGLGGGVRRLRGAVEGVVLSLGDALAPTLATVAAIFQLAAGGARQFIAGNSEIATTIGAVVVGVIAAAAALAILGIGFTTVATGVGVVITGFGAVAGLIGAILSPAALLTAGVIALGVGLLQSSDRARAMFGRFGEGFAALGDTFSKTWGGIQAAISKGDLEGALKIAGAGLNLEWQRVVLYWTKVWSDFKNGWLKDIREMATYVKNSFLGKTVAEIPNVIGSGMKKLTGAFQVGFKAVGITGERIGIRGAGAAAPGPGGPAAPAVDPAVAAAEAKVNAAIAELDRLNAALTEPGLLTPEQGLALEKKRIEDHLGPVARPQLDMGQVRGGFAVPDARGQFGYGDSFEKKQLDTLKDIKDGKGDLPVKIADAMKQGFILR